MRPPITLRFTVREHWAIALAVIFVVSGFSLGIVYHPNWASGFGAIIVVIGVVFAATDLPKELEQRARNIAKVANALMFQDLINELEQDGKQPLSGEARAALEQRYKRLTAHDIDAQASRPRVRFLIVEVTIICTGTLMNGFGQWISECIRNGV